MHHRQLIIRITAFVSIVSISISAAARTAPRPLTAAAIDRQLAVAWHAKHLTPGPLVDDAGFLRRLTIDLTGTIPTAEAVRAFLADKRADKRQRAIDTLLATPEYSLHWASSDARRR